MERFTSVGIWTFSNCVGANGPRLFIFSGANPKKVRMPSGFVFLLMTSLRSQNTILILVTVLNQDIMPPCIIETSLAIVQHEYKQSLPLPFFQTVTGKKKRVCLYRNWARSK